MIRFLCRFVGLWLIAGALVALVVDGAKSIAGSVVTVTPVGLTWLDLSPATLASTEGFLQKDAAVAVGGWVWDPVAQSFLALPTFAVLGIAGGLLAYLGRKRRLRLAYA